MELNLREGRYVSDDSGALGHVEGREEKLQRIFCRLSARRGGFFPMPDFGSKLHALFSLKPSARPAAARQYVHEALEAEDVEVVSVDYVDKGDGSAVISVELELEGEGAELTVNI